MDVITRTPGLIHIAEQIFSNLDRNDLLQCQKVNEYWASILRKVWYNRMKQNTTSTTLSQEQQKEWMNFCEKLRKLNLTGDIIPELNFIYEQLEDSKTLNRAFQFACLSGNNQKSVKIVTLMAPLMENPNAPNGDGNTPIHTAAEYGHTEIVEILAPLTDNPNAPDHYGTTPIILAAENGNTEIVKILANSWLES